MLWLAAAALLAAGCFTASGREATAENRPDLRPLNGVLHFTATESAVLHRAEEREVQKCMASRGFDYLVVPVGDVEREAAVSPYGLLTESQAAQNGYGLGLRRLQKSPSDPNARQLSASSERSRLAWEEALKGTKGGPREEIVLKDGPTVSVPTDSCVSVARRALYGASWDRNYYTLQSLSTSIARNTLKHPLVKAAEDEWAACMRDEGFPYQERENPLKAVKKQLDAAKSDTAAVRAAGREELRIAVADYACQGEVDLAQQIALAQTNVEKDFPATTRSLVKDFKAARQAALKRAEAGGFADRPSVSPSA
jgi:hypothetical protein